MNIKRLMFDYYLDSTQEFCYYILYCILLYLYYMRTKQNTYLNKYRVAICIDVDYFSTYKHQMFC